MRKSWIWVVMLVVAVSVGWPSSIMKIADAHEGEKHDEAAEQAETSKAKKYVCPMHADVQSDKPGECPKCGMTLKQITHEEMSDEDSHEEHDHHHHEHHQ